MTQPLTHSLCILSLSLSLQSLNRSTGSGGGVLTMAHQLSLATLSQDSNTYIDPHIRSFVYDSSQADTETEL